MIEANKKYIHATLQQGTAHIQGSLIQLYTYNLNAIGTQAALIAGFAFQAISNVAATLSTDALDYWYYICYTICLITALFVLTQSTLTAIYGSTLSVRGNDASIVENAAKIMKLRQEFILKIGFACITSLFAGGILQAWTLFDTGVSVILSFLYFVFWIWIVIEGRKTIEECVHDLDATLDKEEAVQMKEELQNKIKDKSETGKVKFIAPTNIVGEKYLVLDSGKLFIYKDEKGYKFQDNCVTKAINLRTYRLREERRISSTGSTIVLEPLVETEIEINPVFEFTVLDDFKNWRKIINDVCMDLVELERCEETIKLSKYEVTHVVKKAMTVESKI